MKLLLHTCCAPCSIQCVETLSGDNIIPDLFWYNPNIHPYTEYRSRRDSLRAFAGAAKLALLEDDSYGLRLFLEKCNMADSAPSGVKKRCAFCYALRLGKAAETAAENGYDAFSTTLLISPYQDHDFIRQTGEEIASTHGLEFVYRDFRPLFREGQSRAREAGYYMQKYCGCIFSEEERYCGNGNSLRNRASGGSRSEYSSQSRGEQAAE